MPQDVESGFMEPGSLRRGPRVFRNPNQGGDMKRDDARDLEMQAQIDRLSRLSEASLRISEGLDLDNLLQGIVDSARSLTGSRYGAITVLGDTEELPAFIRRPKNRTSAAVGSIVGYINATSVGVQSPG